MPDPGPPDTSQNGATLPCDAKGCLLQSKAGLCRVHSQLGTDALPRVCADFPRLINRIDDRLEVTGDLACPEIARLLMTQSGSEQIVELDESVLTHRPVSGLQTRHAVPYIQVSNEIRNFVLTLLSLDGFTPTERLICALTFCAQTITHLHRNCSESDINAVVHIMEHLSDRRRLRAVTDLVMREPIAPDLAMTIIHHTVRLAAAKSETFKPLAEYAFRSYEGSRGQCEYDEIWNSYELRRAQVRSRLGQSIDEAFWRMTYHDWVHAPYVLSPTLAYHAVKLQLPVAVTRWLVYSQPAFISALSDDDDRALKTKINEVIVDVTYKTARAIRHSNLLDVAQNVLKSVGLDHASAALLLSRM